MGFDTQLSANPWVGDLTSYLNSAPTQLTPCKTLMQNWMQDQDAEEEENLVDQCATRLPKVLKDVFSSLDSIAAVLNRNKAIQYLCPHPKKMPISSKRISPLHFRAALTTSKTLKNDAFVNQYVNDCLKANFKVLGNKNKFGQSPIGLLKAMHYFKDKQAELDQLNPVNTPPFFSTNATEVELNLTQDAQCLGDDAVLVSKNVISPQTLASYWKHFSPSSVSNTKKAKQIYDEMIQSPPQISIRLKSAQGYCGVFASKKIEAKQLLMPFVGQVVIRRVLKDSFEGDISEYGLDSHTQNNYQLAIEPKAFRSPAAMINDGPPNVARFIVYNHQGLAEQVYLYALREIQKGEELFFDYGSTHPTKMGPYDIPDQSYTELKNLFSSNQISFAKLYDLYYSANTQGLTSVSDNDFSNLHFFSDLDYSLSMIFYTMATPSVINKLAFEGIISSKDIHSFLNNSEAMNLFQDAPMVLINIVNAAFIAKVREMADSTSYKQILGQIFDILEASMITLATDIKKDTHLRTARSYYTLVPILVLLKGISSGVSADVLKASFEDNCYSKDSGVVSFDDAQFESLNEVINLLVVDNLPLLES